MDSVLDRHLNEEEGPVVFAMEREKGGLLLLQEVILLPRGG